MSKVWPENLLTRRRELDKAEDRVGLRKLQFGRHVFQVRNLIPGLTQAKAAKLAGISRGQWIRMEQGQNLPRPHKIPAIAKAIGVDVEGLYKQAGLKVPKKYMKYDLEAAKREFASTLQEATS